MAGAAGGGGGDGSGLCFFIFSVMIGWSEQQMVATGRLWPLFFYFFL
jgi:hypothetical protein